MAAEAVDMSDGETVRLGDGRRVGWAEFGDPAGEPALYFHGHPGSRLEARVAHATGVRVIALDRPGYGGSDFHERRTLLDWPRDVAEVADKLGLARFAVVGASGGGPYALACAHLLPDRVRRVGVLGGVGPFDAPGATDGMRWQNRVAFGWSARWPPLATALMGSMARNVRRRPGRTLDAFARALPPPDAAIARRPEVRALLAEDFAEAFRQGPAGAAWDVVVLGRPWGFDPAEVRVPVDLWWGEADTLVPPAMGRYLAGRIPGCRAHVHPGEGHLLVFDRIAEVIETLRA